MARGKALLFYRREEGIDIWQYGRYRKAGVQWMLRNGWRQIDWMHEKGDNNAVRFFQRNCSR